MSLQNCVDCRCLLSPIEIDYYSMWIFVKDEDLKCFECDGAYTFMGRGKHTGRTYRSIKQYEPKYCEKVLDGDIMVCEGFLLWLLGKNPFYDRLCILRFKSGDKKLYSKYTAVDEDPDKDSRPTAGPI